MHSIRDRIHISESLDFISSMPLLLKGMYVQNWKYHENPPLDFETLEELKTAVKNKQDQYGECEFDWGKSTEEIISVVLDSMGKYLPEGGLQHVKEQMPKEAQQVFEKT